MYSKTKPRTSNPVAFDYATQQGLFGVTYSKEGYCQVKAYGRLRNDQATSCLFETPVGVTSDMKTSSFSLIGHAKHTIGLDRAGETMSADQVVDLCRADFQRKQVGKTVLETPDQDKLARLQFPVVTWTGKVRKAVLRADGRGYLIEEQSWQETQAGIDNPHLEYCFLRPLRSFKHGLSAEVIIRDAPRILEQDQDGERLRQFYHEYFWETLNPQFDEPWIRYKHELHGEDLTIANCGLDELKSLLVDAITLDTNTLTDLGSVELSANSAIDRDGEPDMSSNGAAFLFRVKSFDLANRILGWAKPTGYFYGNIRGDDDNWRGYAKQPISIDICVKEPTASGRMEALDRLIVWAETAGIDIEHLLPQE